eukprot:2847045-Rhodomonas_salina.4
MPGTDLAYGALLYDYEATMQCPVLKSDVLLPDSIKVEGSILEPEEADGRLSSYALPSIDVAYATTGDTWYRASVCCYRAIPRTDLS